MIKKAKEALFVRKINECHGDQKQRFQIVDKLLGRNKTTSLPYFTNPQIMSTLFNEFFCCKNIKYSDSTCHLGVLYGRAGLPSFEHLTSSI